MLERFEHRGKQQTNPWSMSTRHLVHPRRSRSILPSRAFLFLVAAISLTAYIGMGPCRAQDIDTLITSRTPYKTTVFDEVQDPGERRALVNLFVGKNPAARIRHAEDFFRSYPQSSFLAEVYQVEAKAQIETGDYGAALKNASKSLRLYPENMLLIVSAADVQAQQRLYGQAESSAQNGLDLLRRFARPASVSSIAWVKLKPKLQASCYFSMGRAQMGEALGAGNAAARTEGLNQALSDLAQAGRLNPDDDEVDYLAGLAELALGHMQFAATYFARAWRLKGPLQLKAMGELQTVYTRSPQFRKLSFEDYLRSIPEPAETGHSAKPVAPPPELPQYAGSKSCQQCHPAVFENWSHTGMARMLKPYAPRNIIGDFDHDNTYDSGEVDQWKDGRLAITSAGARNPIIRMTSHRGSDYFDIKDTAGRWHRYHVDYTIGSKWEQAYATRLPNGEIHVFPIQYNRIHKRWVDFWQIIDPPGSPRTDITQWLKLDHWTSYQANCAVCHTSQLRNVKGGGFEPQGLEFREAGIDCEMCHGPSLKHVEAMQKNQLYAKRPMDPPVDFKKITARQFVAICSQCHMQSAVRRPGPEGELNYSRAGDFFMHYKNRAYNEFSRKGFYKDGRFRETTFFVESLLRTECFKKGDATCGSCHDPHPANAASNPTSLKFSGNSDEMCLQCHVEYRGKGAIARHTHHSYQSQGSQCVSCHMPRIVDALLFEARSHEFDQIPDAPMTLKFGEQGSPNACLLCHRHKTAEWVSQELAAWEGTKSRVTGRITIPRAPATQRAGF